jgi:hypothetical protein
MRFVALLLAGGLLVACSDSRIPEASDAAPDQATSSPCSPDCNAGEFCFATGAPDAAPPAGYVVVHCN